MKKEIIAIDGPAASGKSTVAKRIAKELGYKYIDSGAMYRCVALFMLENKLSNNELIKRLSEIKIDFDLENNVYLNDVDVSKEIRGNVVTALVAQVAAIPEVRAYLVALQQSYGIDKGIVMDGRDIGTVVFKDAKVKIYQIASVKARAMRRHKENLENNIESDLKMIEDEIQKRDDLDKNREISPLIKADDAIEIDTSDNTIEENVAKVLEIFKEKVK